MKAVIKEYNFLEEEYSHHSDSYRAMAIPRVAKKCGIITLKKARFIGLGKSFIAIMMMIIIIIIIRLKS